MILFSFRGRKNLFQWLSQNLIDPSQSNPSAKGKERKDRGTFIGSFSVLIELNRLILLRKNHKSEGMHINAGVLALASKSIF